MTNNEGGYPHQDWTPVVIRRPQEKPKVSGPNYGSQQARKLDESEEADSIRLFDRDFAKKVQDARVAKGWNQKQLAIQLNKTQDVVRDLEQGRLKYDPALKSKINRVFGFRKDKKT